MPRQKISQDQAKALQMEINLLRLHDGVTRARTTQATAQSSNPLRHVHASHSEKQARQCWKKLKASRPILPSDKETIRQVLTSLRWQVCMYTGEADVCIANAFARRSEALLGVSRLRYVLPCLRGAS